MTSPFQTIDEFNGAINGPTEGAIYTFANSPGVNNIALLVSVALFIWFVVGTYSPHHSLPKLDKSLNGLSSAIVVGLLSLVAADFRQPPGEIKTAAMHRSAIHRLAIAPLSNSNPRQSSIPLGLLGMMGVGLRGIGLAGITQHRRRRQNRRSRSRRL